MKVRAKFLCNTITRHMGQRQNPETKQWEPAEQRTVAFTPVYGKGDPDHENTKFWAATPSGRLELTMVNVEAAEGFEIGREYYLGITPA